MPSVAKVSDEEPSSVAGQKHKVGGYFVGCQLFLTTLHIMKSLGIKPVPHWWDAVEVTTDTTAILPTTRENILGSPCSFSERLTRLVENTIYNQKNNEP